MAMNPAESALPSLHLLLTPQATENGDITILQFSVTVQRLPHKAGGFLCAYNDHQDDVNSSPPENLLRDFKATLRDSDGDLPLALFDVGDDGEREIFVAREARGDIVFSSDINALRGDEAAHDISALQHDQGGIIGVGRYFLPWFKTDNRCHFSVEWDLANCPEGTRALCSFGEGPEVVEATGNSETLLECVFMVGPIRSHLLEHLQEEKEVGGVGFCGTYWFGNLPNKLGAAKDYASKIFPRMSGHFNNEGGSYRAFLRRVLEGFDSKAFHSSSIIDYDADVEKDHDWDVIRTLNRPMVSAWAQLTPEDNGRKNWWFTDGLAFLYTVYLPFRFGLYGPDYFRATVNAFLSSYYTNPLISRRLVELESMDPQDSWYVTSAKTTRAFVYMLKMDTYTRRAAVARGEDVARPIDELVRALCTRVRAGERVQKKDWLEGLASWIGREDADRYFQEMMENGKVNELDDMLSSFGSTYGPQPVEQEPLEFGFDQESLYTGVVTGVASALRAHEAGLRTGDRVVWKTRLETCGLHYGEMFKLGLSRAGKPIEMEYLPRARKNVMCWQVLERAQPSG